MGSTRWVKSLLANFAMGKEKSCLCVVWSSPLTLAHPANENFCFNTRARTAPPAELWPKFFI
jgi:hypothetical protein